MAMDLSRATRLSFTERIRFPPSSLTTRTSSPVSYTHLSAMKDLTVGSPMKLVFGFAVPLLFGFLFQQMYNFVDTAIVGRFLGSAALAAVGATGSLNFLILGFCMGICSGFSIPIAQSFGAKDETELRRYVTNSVWLSAVISVIMAVVTALGTRTMLQWMNLSLIHI